ncbi:MAG: Lrp/AsnC family transcriptional regulator [Pseudomonadota bacterium]
MGIVVSEKDEALLRLLGTHARLSTAELGRRLGISRTTVQSRLERLERSGIIEGYTVRLSDAYHKGRVRASVLMVIAPRALISLIPVIKKLPSVDRIQSVSGPYDLVVDVNAADMQQLDTTIDALGEMEGVEKTISLIVLSTRFER